MRLNLLFASALLLMISVWAVGETWGEYSNRTDAFSINFPGEPSVREITYKTEYAISLPARVYTKQDGSNRYSLTVVDYTVAEKIHADRVRSCKAAGGDGDLCNDHGSTEIRGALIYATWNFFQRDAKVTHLSYSNVDRIEGNELQLTNPDGSRTFASVHMHENRLYILEGTVAKGSPPPALFQD